MSGSEIQHTEVQLTGAWPLDHSWPLPTMFGAVGRPRGAGVDAAGTLPVIAPANADRLRAQPDIGFWECDLRDNGLSWTSRVFDLFGLPRDVAPLRSDAVACYDEESREAMELLRAYAIRHRRGFTLDARIIRPDGQHRWMRLTTGVACTGGRALRLYGTKRDMTLEHERGKALARSTPDIDAMTGLLTRAGFERRLLQMLSDDGIASAALLLIDVEDVEQIRRRFGAAAGDACLAGVGAALTRNAVDVLIAGRLDDCRFGLLVRVSADRDMRDHALGRLVRAVAEPIFWQGYLLRVAPCCGMALMSEEIALEPDMLFALAAERLNAARARRSI